MTSPPRTFPPPERRDAQALACGIVWRGYHHQITNIVIIHFFCSSHSINSAPGNGRVEEKNRAGMTLFPSQPLFHCLDAQILTGFAHPLLRGIRRSRRIGTTGYFGTASKTHLLRVRAEQESLKHWEIFDIWHWLQNRVSWVRVLVPLDVKSPESLSRIGFRGFFLVPGFWA